MKAFIPAVFSLFLFFLGDAATAQDNFPCILESNYAVDVYYPGCSDDKDTLSYNLRHTLRIYNPTNKAYKISQIRTNRHWKFGKPDIIASKDTLEIEFSTPEYKHNNQFKIFDDVFIIDFEGGLSLNDRQSFITIGYGCRKEELKDGSTYYMQSSQDGLPDFKLLIDEDRHPVMLGKTLDDGTEIGSFMYWDEKGQSRAVLKSSIAQLTAHSNNRSITDIEINAFVEDSIYHPRTLNSESGSPYAFYSFDPKTSKLVAETSDLIGEQLFFQDWREFEMVIMSMGKKGKGYAYDQNQRIFFEDTLTFCIKSNLGLDGRANVEMAVAQELKSMGLESWSNPLTNPSFYFVNMKDISIESRTELYKKLSNNMFIEDWGLCFKQPGFENLMMLTRDFYIYTPGNTDQTLIDGLVNSEKSLVFLKSFQQGVTNYIHLQYQGNVNIDYLNFLNALLSNHKWIQSYQLNFDGYQTFPESK